MEERMRKLALEMFSVSPDEFRMDATFQEMGVDSLEMVEFFYEVDTEFEVSIPDEEASKMQTPQEVLSWIERHKNGDGNPK